MQKCSPTEQVVVRDSLPVVHVHIINELFAHANKIFITAAKRRLIFLLLNFLFNIYIYIIYI